MAMVILVFWCKCKRGPVVERPITHRDLELQVKPDDKGHLREAAEPDSKHPVTDAKRRAMEEKYRKNFTPRK